MKSLYKKFGFFNTPCTLQHDGSQRKSLKITNICDKDLSVWQDMSHRLLHK